MARQPAQLVGGKGLRQQLWNRICLLDGDFAITDIIHGDECVGTARDYIVGLERGGYLAVTIEAVSGWGRQKQKRWKLVKNVGIDAPRVRKDGTPVTMGLAQEQMWRTLRMLKSDTNARELAAHASTPAIPVAATAAADYLRCLHHADYLQMTQAARSVMRNGGKSQARYRLKPSANTGPRAPMVCRTHVLYDPNTDQTHAIERVTEEVAIYGK